MEPNGETAGGPIGAPARSHTISASVLGLAVLCIVLLAGVLESAPEGGKEEARAERLPSPSSAVPILPEAKPQVSEPEREPEAVPPVGGGRPDRALAPSAPGPSERPLPRAGSLAERARSDLARISRHADRYTAQLAIACKVANAERLLRTADRSPSLYVLPVDLEGRSCFRVCWGVYDSFEEAAAAADLPAPLRGIEPKPRPVLVSKILP